MPEDDFGVQTTILSRVEKVKVRLQVVDRPMLSMRIFLGLNIKFIGLARSLA